MVMVAERNLVEKGNREDCLDMGESDKWSEKDEGLEREERLETKGLSATRYLSIFETLDRFQKKVGCSNSQKLGVRQTAKSRTL